MIYPDSQTLRILVKERHAQLARDALRTDAPEAAMTEGRIRRHTRRVRLSRFWFHVRPARGGP